MTAPARKKNSSPKPGKKVGEARAAYQARNANARPSRPNAIVTKRKETLAQYYGEQRCVHCNP